MYVRRPLFLLSSSIVVLLVGVIARNAEGISSCAERIEARMRREGGHFFWRRNLYLRRDKQVERRKIVLLEANSFFVSKTQRNPSNFPLNAHN